jgi:exonuclease VII small subunit
VSKAKLMARLEAIDKLTKHEMGVEVSMKSYDDGMWQVFIWSGPEPVGFEAGADLTKAVESAITQAEKAVEDGH